MSFVFSDESEINVALSQWFSSICTISVGSSRFCCSSGVLLCDAGVSCLSLLLFSFVFCFTIWLSSFVFSELVLIDCSWVTNWLLAAVVVSWVPLARGCCNVIYWFYWGRVMCGNYRYELGGRTSVIGWGD